MSSESALVADLVPEQVRALRAAADQARAEDRVGDARADRRDELGDVDRVVLEVGVLDHDDAAAGLREARAQRGALALVALVAHELDAVEALDDGCRAVLRAVVDDDDLERVRQRRRRSMTISIVSASL